MSTNNKGYDRRTVDRYVDKGLIKATEYQSFLKALPDDAANAQWVQMDMEDAEVSSRSNGSANDTDPEEGA
jgi:hypothetical protein